MIRSRDIDKGRFEFSNKHSIIILLVYFVGYVSLAGIVGVMLTKLIFKVENAIHPSILMAIILAILVGLVYLVREPLMASFRFFKKNVMENFKIVLKNFGYLWIFSIVTNIVLSFILGDRSSVNQSQVVDGIAVAPVLYAVMTMVFAPIVEELVFRGVLYQKFRSEKNYHLAIFISITLFGLVHVLQTFMITLDWTEFLFMFQYAGLAYFMVRSFEETSSIWGSISIHFLNNALGFILVFMTL